MNERAGEKRIVGGHRFLCPLVPFRVRTPRTAVICVTRSPAQPKKVHVNEETSLSILFFPTDCDHAGSSTLYAFTFELCHNSFLPVIYIPRRFSQVASAHPPIIMYGGVIEAAGSLETHRHDIFYPDFS